MAPDFWPRWMSAMVLRLSTTLGRQPEEMAVRLSSLVSPQDVDREVRRLEFIDQLMDVQDAAEDFAERRGAAQGLTERETMFLRVGFYNGAAWKARQAHRSEQEPPTVGSE